MKSGIMFAAAALMLVSAAICFIINMTIVVSLGFCAAALAFFGAGLNYRHSNSN